MRLSVYSHLFVFFTGSAFALGYVPDGTIAETLDAATDATKQPVKSCPVTSLGQGVYKFACNDGESFARELAEFLASRQTREIQAISPLDNYGITQGYVVVTSAL